MLGNTFVKTNLNNSMNNWKLNNNLTGKHDVPRQLLLKKLYVKPLCNYSITNVLLNVL